MKVPEEKGTLIAIDVGGGTQDILVYREGQTIENCPKMVMPSPTQLVARQIESATADGKAVFLWGELMGGGVCGRAAKEHISAGLPLYATERAALTFNDDLERVRTMGIVITETAPPEAVSIKTGDIDREGIGVSLKNFGVEVPRHWAVAVQDHGFSPGRSNREARFEWYREFIETGGALNELAFREPPALFTRMHAIKRVLPDALVMDTGPAAIAGALMDDVVREHMGAGLIVVNAGNYHVMCAMVRDGRMLGLLEHHTGLFDRPGLSELIHRFRDGDISDDEVRADGGHGCHVRHESPGQGSFDFVAVTGPKREILRDSGVHMAVPYGDMMLTGCFGLLAAAKDKGLIPQ
jgi:uncharacterized protein (DUF1786 family)